MSQYIPATLREQVLSQAGGLCAYCRSAEALLGVTFEIDHIVPLSAGGGTTADNLCLSCPTCNRQKGIRQTAPDPVSGEETPLFHPLAQAWDDHFTWSDDGATVIGLTPAGRATMALLRINRPVLVQMRCYWVAQFTKRQQPGKWRHTSTKSHSGQSRGCSISRVIIPGNVIV